MILINDVTKIYDNGTKGIANVSFTVKRGDFVFLVGASGSGKSTIVKLILKEIEPSEGEISVNNQNLARITRKQLPFYRRKIGVVFQDFRLLKNLTVYENVAFAMQIVQTPGREIRRAVPAVLAMVGLQKKAKAYPNQLSGGEQQRTALARAIVNKPSILVADEPTGNLDPNNSWEIMNLLEDINNRGTTVVVATHAKDIVDQMQKRVITLHNGILMRDISKGGYEDEV